MYSCLPCHLLFKHQINKRYIQILASCKAPPSIGSKMPPPALMHFYCLHPLFLHVSPFLPHTTTTSLSPSATFCSWIGVAIPHLPHAPLFYPFLLLTRSFSFFASFFSDRPTVTLIFTALTTFPSPS